MKTTTIGTAWFPRLADALAYYLPYGNDREEVERKVQDGEIHIGDPPRMDGEIRRWVADRRWHIEVAK